MKRIACVISAALLLLSCATARKGAPTADEQNVAPLLAAFCVSGNPDGMPDAERVALETAALKIVAAGAAAVEAVLADIGSNRDGERRKALVKLLVLIREQMPIDSPARADAGKRIEQAGRRLLASSEASDRYAATILMALPTRSQLVPAALQLLDDDDGANRAFANIVLRQVAQIDLGYNPDAAAADRGPAARRWREWWANNKDRSFFYMPNANPVLSTMTAEMSDTARQAGPYPLEVTDPSGAPVAGAVVTYSYYFTTFDGSGRRLQKRTSTDDNGRMLMGGETMAPGMKFLGAQIIVSKSGSRDVPVAISPHLLTRNSFSIAVTLAPETK